MDHMMPKLNGIEATEIIREKGYNEPIVALTANAVVGQSDIFLANGFDDFISKPIDIRHLNTLLKKYIRDKQPPEVIEAALKAFEGMEAQAIDKSVQSAVSPQLAEFFVRDVLNAVEALKTIDDKLGAYNDEDVSLFTTTAHAMKTALANVGEMQLSALADRLEQAGWKNETEVISAETSDFISKLRATAFKFSPPEDNEEYAEAEDGDYAYLQQELSAVNDACVVYDKKKAKEIIAGLRQKRWLPEINQMLGKISEKLLSGDLDGVAQYIEKINEIANDNL